MRRADMVFKDALSYAAKGEMVRYVQMFREHTTRSGLGSAGVTTGRDAEPRGAVSM